MSGGRSFGLHRFRRHAIRRAVARLCLIVITLNLVAPIAWAAAAGPTADFAAVPICHGVTPGEQPFGSQSDADHKGSLIPHCPLCVLFGGTVWAPAAAVPVALINLPSRAAPTPVIRAPVPVVAPDSLRPGPRAPPALT